MAPEYCLAMRRNANGYLIFYSLEGFDSKKIKIET